MSNNSFSAMILAAGYGKRMMPITKSIPKPLVEINKVSLLKNVIDFLLRINCKKIVINTHFKHELIFDFIKKNYSSSNIFLTYEKKILDTGGGVKNALKLFDDDKILVTNSDIYWTKDNEQHVKNFLLEYKNDELCKLLLVEKKNANGINKHNGDFALKNNLISRWKEGDDLLYYTGMQIISCEIIKSFHLKKFSFNEFWDFCIKNKSLYGYLMQSNWYHVGDLKGLNQAINANT